MRLYAEQRGASGTAVVFLHGLAASGRYWHPVADRLEGGGLCLYLVDLLGFGRSPWPAVAYTLEDHLGALDKWRAAAGLAGEPLVLVGHSVGALIALGWAARAPAVAGAVLAGLPIYHDSTEARRRLAGLSLLNRLILGYPSLARAACMVMCHTRPLWRLVAPLLAPEMPAEVARDAVLHTWRSLSGTLERCVFGTDLDSLGHQTAALSKLFLHGADDETASVVAVRKLVTGLANARLVEIAHAGHDLPLSHPEQLADALSDFVCGLGPG